MENKITIVTSSRKPVTENKEFIDNVHNTCGCECEIQYVENSNGVSLTEIYNKHLKESETDIIAFIHDDIEFLREGWGTELIRLFNENEDYGIIGVAGAAEFDERGMWWNYKKRYGQVVHRQNGKSWLTMFSDLISGDLREVCVVDGLFIAVHRKRISRPFDERFKGFNHYDTSFCLGNYIEGYPRIGVTTNIRIAHSSVGETKQNFFDNLKLLNEVYHEYYPIDVDEDLKLDNK